jgi:hypothetical protein
MGAKLEMESHEACLRHEVKCRCGVHVSTSPLHVTHCVVNA